MIGDAAYCCDRETGRPLPMMAQTALHQGQYVAYTIRREMYGRRTFPYVPVKNRFIIPLGGRYAVWGGLRFRFGGVLPYFAKRLISLYYFLSILPPRRAFRLWRRSVKIYSENNIIS
ncbi:MAG: hypothetical protein HZA25_03455 [Candidatus Niyogibacteria bacterium]|nr:hypothetical protein [Candidatus Niyogibacteria bacterium]